MYSISSAIFDLQSETSLLNNKLIALRFLDHCLKSDASIDSYNRKRINQIILDSILKIILSEDKNTNIRKQQLVRAELFVLLARLLNSNVLFGDVLSNPDIIANARLNDLKNLSSGEDGISVSLLQPHDTEASINTSNTQSMTKTGRTLKSSSSEKILHSTHANASKHSRENDISSSHKADHSMHLLSKSTASVDGSLQTDKSLRLHLLGQSIQKHTRKLLAKNLRPRPSVLFSDKMESDSFVPGADPYNFIEQDRKLGYQKPRMWFPTPGISVDSSLLPADRNGATKAPSATERVVQEYLQMRALASYVGDLVMPFTPSLKTQGLHNLKHQQLQNGGSNSSAVSIASSRLAGFTDNSKFNAALQEASAIWSPLLGVHLPEHMKNNANPAMIGKDNQHREMRGFKQLRFQDEEGSQDTYSDTLSQLQSLDEDGSSTSTSVKVSIGNPTVSAMKRKNIITPYSADYSMATGSRHKNVWNPAEEDEDEMSSFQQMQRYQTQVRDDFAKRRDDLATALRSSEAIIAATIKSQYAKLPPNYIVLLEGSKANARKLIANTLFIFCRVKRRALLELALGVWKICLVQKLSIANRVKYARTAALYLMASWAIRVKLKNLRSWLGNWRRSVMLLIFNERTEGTVVIQTLYRTWRDRRRFVEMHHAGVYNGILSDVYLAAQRTVKYHIPYDIRNTRRMLWKAAIVVQSRFRCWVESREYLHKRMLIVKLQSVVRMFPRYMQFKRLKATTIKCQAWMRRTVKRRWYKRLKRATVIIQKYVRRYLSFLRRQRICHSIWRSIEVRLASAILIQCRWRIHVSHKKVKGKKFHIKMRRYAALVIQRNYYRHRKAFHTFFLLCCLSAREEEDRKLRMLAVTMGRRQCARRIQRFYKMRYFKRNITAVVRVQCWFRGRQGYNVVDILRRQRWATRKLHHWARGMIYRRHRLVRKIQHWWWRLKKGRLLTHLWYRLAVSDKEWDHSVSEAKYRAAGKIQAYVKGSWDRRWVRRHRAAIRIQRNFRFFNGLRRWRNWKRDKILKGVRRYVGMQLERALKSRVKALMRRHSRMLIKPQSLIRGFVVRAVFKRVRSFAYRLGLAAVLIQRFWRKTGAMSRAVEEVMSLRRMENNPFKTCETLHEVLLTMRRQCTNYYSSFDPRVGLRISSFLFRLGYIDLLEMFPRKDFLYVSDLQGLSMERMHSLYNTWRLNVSKRKDKKKAEEDDGQSRSKRPKPPPVQIFQTILDIVNPPFFSQKKSHVDVYQQILSVQEHLSPNRMLDFSKKLFLKKFGKHLLTRAQNVSREVVELMWTNYNNYKAFGSGVATKAQLVKAMANASESSHVITSLDDVRQRHIATASDERKWDNERVFKCSELLQLAVDQARKILPAGPLQILLEKAVARVASLRRKVLFLQSKYKAGKRAKIKVKPNASVPIVHSSTRTANDNTSDIASEVTSINTQSVVRNANPLDNMASALTVSDSVDLPYCGTEDDLELEQSVCICKIYLEVLDRLHTATCGIQSLKNLWNNSAVKRAVAAEKLRVFLDAATKEYIQEQHVDRVKIVWLKFRRIEMAAQKLRLIIQAIKDRKVSIEAELQYIPRHGWQAFEDENGYTYYTDMHAGSYYESSYDMPTYSYKQWLAAIKIQRVGRIYSVFANERHRIREEIKQAEIAATKARLEEEIRLGAKYVSLRISVQSVPLPQVETHHKHRHKTHETFAVPELESMLPWRYQFEQTPDIRTGSWALLRHDSKTAGVDATFDIVMVFKVRQDKNLCDVRLVKGTRIRNVHMDRLRQMNLDVGTHVEARYKSRKLFYRASVCHIDSKSTFYPRYDVRYEDGEIEKGLSRDLLRPTTAALNEFLKARHALLPDLKKRHKRLTHIAALKRTRIAEEIVAASASVSSTLLPAVTEDVIDAEDVIAQDDDIISEAVPVEGDEMSMDSRSQASLQSNRQMSVASDAVSKLSRKSVVSKRSDGGRKHSDGQISTSLSVQPGTHRISLNVRIRYTRFPLLHGWSEQQDDQTGQTYYLHRESGDATMEKPTYSAEQTYLIQKCQAMWHVYRARKLLRRKVLSYSLDHLVQSTIERGSKIAYIGYGLEGVTTMQLLRRAGCWEMADAIEHFYKSSKMNIATLTISQIIDRHKENFESIGILQTNHLRDAKELQTWWKRTSTSEREKKLTLFNYFSGPDDHRTIQECIYDRRDVLIDKFLRVFKSTQSRTRTACMSIIEESMFPHSALQVETYIKRYADKPELARESVYELINKPTTHTWVEERVVYRMYQETTRRIAAILNNLKLKRLCKIVREAAKRAENVMKEIQLLQVDDKPRPHCTGPEAKAALILRTQVLHFITKCINAAIKIQRKARAYHLAKVWKVYLHARIVSTNLLQRAARKYLAFKIARKLQAQRASDWEQLWDGKRRLLYYYNRAANYSTYEEPAEPFRPLVRDPRSAILVQAWPGVGTDYSGGEDNMPSQSNILPRNAMCSVCQVRKGVRICYDCSPTVNYEDDPYGAPSTLTPYCFTCFIKEHIEDNGKLGHNFDVVAATDGLDVIAKSSLKCSMCDNLATRKCLGALNDEEIETICVDLKHSEPDKWASILQKANVAGDRKISILLDQIRDTDAKKSLVSSQLDEVRTLLQRLRSECDECYCASCYVEVHSGGKRAAHRWFGFQENAPVCTVCTNSPAEISCVECQSEYCNSCYQTFHMMGRKRRHKKERLLEPLEEGDVMCSYCTRRVGAVTCPNEKCETCACDSCYEFCHKSKCDKVTAIIAKKKQSSKFPALSAHVCVVCGDPADKLCTQCGDAYCSKTWMGNPGCFVSYHSKGNRALHTTQTIRLPPPGTRRK